MNLTDGYSAYCGGIEIRRKKDLVFSYQTISRVKSWFCIALSDVLSENTEIKYSNVLSVSLISGEAEKPFPGVIYIRGSSDSNLKFSVNNFVFYDTNLSIENSFLVSRGVNEEAEQTIRISFIDCVADVAIDRFAYNDGSLNIVRCVELAKNPEINLINHLNLGECEGVETFINATYFFTLDNLPRKITILKIGLFFFPLILP